MHATPPLLRHWWWWRRRTCRCLCRFSVYPSRSGATSRRAVFTSTARRLVVRRQHVFCRSYGRLFLVPERLHGLPTHGDQPAARRSRAVRVTATNKRLGAGPCGLGDTVQEVLWRVSTTGSR